VAADKIEAAVEEARVSDRLARLEAFETEERAFHGQLLAVCSDTRDGLHELVAQGQRREERELAALKAQQAALEQELTARSDERKWWRQLVSERVIVPLVTGGTITSIIGAAAAWAFGGE
jgi:hypothetical protein